MIPILYESGETEFTNNGLGRLRDCTECVVTEERNGVYELDFSYPVDGFHYEDIQLGRIIAVEHDDTDDVQPFDIISYSKPINGIVSFHAVHVSYRLCKVTTSGTNIDNLVSALDMLRAGVPENPFTYWTDKASTGYMASADGVPRSVRQFLGGIEGSILDTYGGEYEFDKFDVHLWDARGEVRDLTIRYGVNLTDYNEEVDYSDTYTNCIPYWTGDDGTGKTIVIKGSIVGTGRSAYNGRYECVPLDLTDKFENQPTTAQLESAALRYMNANQVYLPEQNIKVDFIRLQDTEEFKQFAPLMECRLCDSIHVEFPKYGTSGLFKIVRTVYDVLLERFEEMELGTLSTSLSEALGITRDGAERTGGIHIVETGVNGIWTWRKWSDGTAECWGTFYKTVSIAAGGHIAAGVGAFPSIFVARPIATVSGGGTANPNIFASYSNSYSTSGGYGLDAYWKNLGSGAFNNQAWMDIHVIGRWK